MLKQEPLSTHDGRAGNRGAIVNIASQLGIVSTYSARKLWFVYFDLIRCERRAEYEANEEQRRTVRQRRLLYR